MMTNLISGRFRLEFSEWVTSAKQDIWGRDKANGQQFGSVFKPADTSRLVDTWSKHGLIGEVDSRVGIKAAFSRSSRTLDRMLPFVESEARSGKDKGILNLRFARRGALILSPSGGEQFRRLGPHAGQWLASHFPGSGHARKTCPVFFGAARRLHGNFEQPGDPSRSIGRTLGGIPQSAG
jgi:hypothetical protein